LPVIITAKQSGSSIAVKIEYLLTASPSVCTVLLAYFLNQCQISAQKRGLDQLSASDTIFGEGTYSRQRSLIFCWLNEGNYSSIKPKVGH
jgi:hypothetical protein